MRRTMIAGLLLTGVFFCFGNKDAFVIREAKVTLVKGQAELRILLENPATLMVYYDTQKPAKPDDVGSFWYSHYDGGEVALHRVTLPELTNPPRLYFRVERKSGESRLSGVYFWDGTQTVLLK